MTIGVYTIDLHLPAARSLKDKRQVLRKLKDRLRTRHNVSVVETSEHANLWQRGRLTVDRNYCTTVPGIYAAGDVIGFPSLASTSMEQGRLAACHAFDASVAGVAPKPRSSQLTHRQSSASTSTWASNMV